MKAFVLVGLALGQQSPVAQVVALLEKLERDVQNTGAESAQVYDEFACFCKDETNEKAGEIEHDEDTIKSLKADLEEYEATKKQLGEDIMTLETQLDSLDTSMKTMTGDRETAHGLYVVSSQDSQIAIDQMDDSLAALGVNASDLNASNATAFLQADEAKPKSSAALLSKARTDGAQSDIIGIISDLRSSIIAKKEETDSGENSSVVGYNGTITAKREEHVTAAASLATKKELLSQCESDIASTTDDLQSWELQLASDQEYLKELTAECEGKAKEWDQESKMRANELAAISKALEIITGDVASENAKLALTKVAKKTAIVTDFMQAGSGSAAIEPYVDVVFAQTRLARTSVAQTSTQRVLDMLQRAARKQNSAALTKLVATLTGGPFAKVTTVIQRLIEELVEAAADEAAHKGWCDTEMGKAETERTHRQDGVAALNEQLEVEEARKAELEARKRTLNSEVTMLQTVLGQATSMRADEKQANMDTITAASLALSALRKALTTLEDFYRTANMAAVDEAPETVSDSAVQTSMGDSGVSGPTGEAYKGNRAGGAGVISMLKTIEANFQRTIDYTTDLESKSLTDFNKFSEETSAAIKGKQTGWDTAEDELTLTTGDLEAHLEDLKRTQNLLDTSLTILEDLKPQCLYMGMSYEEHKERREAEIATLKYAVCLLEDGDSEIGTNCDDLLESE
jgi:hypothetical protein